MSLKRFTVFFGYTIGIFVLAIVLVSFFSSRNLNKSQSYDAGFANNIGMPAPTMLSFSDRTSTEVMPAGQKERMSTLDSTVTILVKQVDNVQNMLSSKVNELGGFVIAKNVYKPSEGGSGYMSVRIPRERKQEFIDFAESNAIKLLSFNESGNDITEEYYDAKQRVATLERTKLLLEDAQKKATTSKDITDVAIQINQIQDQIDYAKGRERYLEEVSKTVVVTVDMQTDEYALPYSPESNWSPEKAFKNAVRAMVLFVRFLGSALIWVLVFTPVFLVGFGVVYLVAKLFKRIFRKQS